MGGCLSYRLKLVRECDELPKSVKLFGKVTCFSFKTLKKATSNFNPDVQIRDNGDSKCYKGILDDGSQVEVVVFSSIRTEFISIISIMSGLKHNNVVELIGYCIEGHHRILVHEFVGLNTLDQLLLSDADSNAVLDWPTRVSVCHGIACGLDHLHNGIIPRVVHCDIKPSNIIMDTSFNPKIIGFDLSCLLEEGESHHSGCVAGTIGYLDPELFHTGRFSEKTDVYAFGITLLQIVTGYGNMLSFFQDHKQTSLPDRVWELRQSGSISEIVDEKLSDLSEDEVKRLICVALSCVQCPSNLRPSMSEVRVMLSDSYDYSKIVLTAPSITVTQQEPMTAISSDSGVSVNLLDDEDIFFENLTR